MQPGHVVTFHVSTFYFSYIDLRTTTVAYFTYLSHEVTFQSKQEPLVCVLKRADLNIHLPDSVPTTFYNTTGSRSLTTDCVYSTELHAVTY